MPSAVKLDTALPSSERTASLNDIEVSGLPLPSSP
jgi:hypothetical protein